MSVPPNPLAPDAEPSQAGVRPGRRLPRGTADVRLRTDNAEARVRARGRYFGYPHCCIDAFVRVELPGPEYFLDAIAPWWGTGFIPCAACAAGLPRAGGIESPGMSSFIERVIAPARSCPLPFPQEPAPEQVDRGVIEMLAAEAMAQDAGAPPLP